MQKLVISTTNAPKAVGPYSQAVLSESLLFLSGQIPLDPGTGQMVQGDIRMQTRRVLENVSAVLEASSSSFSQVVKTTVFLTDMGDFSEMNSVYAEYFQKDFPARSTVQVAALPLGARVEIEVIARKTEGQWL